jgi:hypothetical protein
MLALLRRANVPTLSLRHAMSTWAQISIELAEPRRQRKRQLAALRLF